MAYSKKGEKQIAVLANALEGIAAQEAPAEPLVRTQRKSFGDRFPSLGLGGGKSK